ncbi:uncharacterized protein CLUP02_00909 [Colletotrichum lupini]|uniref:Uncharacterized protein n=1 Tax=Colletotrichum lupini TaxID=145971 RepID=A0A9Q8SC88_9PEZI|nr:uncharacterized protein CLUP02_00909 [Colletotrichum lupini]UQC74261.1 hypothetical protein CLUP02_00909 [Colletotrichum lupini]
MLQNIHFLALVTPPPCIPYIITLKHGDGNPQKKFLHKQVTATHMCTGGPCSVEKEDSETYTIEWSASIADPRGFFSAGFAVSEAIITGVTKACSN